MHVHDIYKYVYFLKLERERGIHLDFPGLCLNCVPEFNEKFPTKQQQGGPRADRYKWREISPLYMAFQINGFAWGVLSPL